MRLLTGNDYLVCEDECGRRAILAVIWPPTGSTDYICLPCWLALTLRVLLLRLRGRDPYAPRKESI